MPVMKGGGAERVAAQLMNEFHRNGHNVTVLLTSSYADEVMWTDLEEGIPVLLMQEEVDFYTEGICAKVSRLLASAFCRLFETMGRQVPNRLSKWSFVTQYRKEIQYLRNMMKKDPHLTVIAFLQPAIPLTVIAGRNLSNKVIFSERGNPERLMKHMFLRKRKIS